MKKLVSLLTVSLLGLGLATGAWAQARPSGDTGAKKTDDAQRQAWSPDANAIETSKLVGTTVKTVDGKSIGAIDQLIVNHAVHSVHGSHPHLVGPAIMDFLTRIDERRRQ